MKLGGLWTEKGAREWGAWTIRCGGWRSQLVVMAMLLPALGTTLPLCDAFWSSEMLKINVRP